MSAENPYHSEIMEATCVGCPLRQVSENRLAEMSQGEDPYYFADKLADGRGAAVDESDATAGMEYLFDRISFTRKEGEYELPDRIDFEMRGEDMYAVHEPIDGKTINRAGELIVSVPESEWPVQSHAVLGCLRRAIAGDCRK